MMRDHVQSWCLHCLSWCHKVGAYASTASVSDPPDITGVGYDGMHMLKMRLHASIRTVAVSSNADLGSSIPAALPAVQCTAAAHLRRDSDEVLKRLCPCLQAGRAGVVAAQRGHAGHRDDHLHGHYHPHLLPHPLLRVNIPFPLA